MARGEGALGSARERALELEGLAVSGADDELRMRLAGAPLAGAPLAAPLVDG